MKDIEYIQKHLQSVTERSLNESHNAFGRWTDLLARGPCRGWYHELPDNQNANSRLKRMLTRVLPRRLAWSSKDRDRHPMAHDLSRMPQKTTATVRVIAGLIISICSGASIIVPMVIMSFEPGRTKSLVTSSVAILIFGFVLAAVIRAKEKEVFVATATYAAVLIVFVGASGTGASGNGGVWERNARQGLLQSKIFMSGAIFHCYHRVLYLLGQKLAAIWLGRMRGWGVRVMNFTSIIKRLLDSTHGAKILQISLLIPLCSHHICSLYIKCHSKETNHQR